MSWPLIGRDSELARLSGLVNQGRGLVLLGEMGVGKSRLLQECLDQMDRGDRVILRAFATTATRSIPFAPFVDLLPETQTQDPLQLYRHVLTELDRRRTSGPLLLSVDDAHLLDEGSLALLTSIASTGSAVLALTARSDDPIPTSLASLWKDQWIDRIELEPLSRDAIHVIAKAVLGEVEPELDQELWRLTLGNPLVLRELIEDSRVGPGHEDIDALRPSGGASAGTPGLTDIVENRLAGLLQEERDLLELVAIGGPLPLSGFAEPDLASISHLEDRHLVATTVHSGTLMVGPSHPLYGELLAASLGEAHRRQIYRHLTAMAQAAGPAGAIDPLRIAVWQRQSGSHDDPGVALMGAGIALSRHDARLAESLVRPVLGESKAAAPSALLGLALSYQGRYPEAEEVLKSAELGDAGTNATIASGRAHNLAFGLGRVEEAVRVLAEASESTTDGALKGRLDSERSMLAAIPGDFAEVFVASRATLDNPMAGTTARASAFVSLALAQAMTADCVGFFQSCDEGLETAGKARVELPLAEDQILVMKAYALIDSGRVAESLRMAEERCSEVGVAGVMRATWLGQIAVSSALQGQLITAVDTMAKSVESMAGFDPFGMQQAFVGLHALYAGQVGDSSLSSRVEGLLADAREPRIRVWLGRGKAWTLAAAGDTRQAATIAEGAGKEAMVAQHVSWGAGALHDAVRLGRPGLVAGVLEEAARISQGAVLIEAMSDHADSLDEGDAGKLAEVATRFASHGCLLYAAEASAQAASAFADHGLAEEASREALCSAYWESQCQSFMTPAVTDRPPLLLPRETEVALAAAAGESGPDIAARLFISHRTVNNHLASVYRKTGTGGREELANLLPKDRPPSAVSAD